MPPDRKPLIGRHRSAPTPGWQRANPTGQRGSGPTIGSSRGTSGWQRANPTGSRGGTSLGTHRAPSASSAPTYDDPITYNTEDESPEYETYTTPADDASQNYTYNTPADDDAPHYNTDTPFEEPSLYNNEDEGAENETYTPFEEPSLYNNEDEAPHYNTYTPFEEPSLYNNEDEAAENETYNTDLPGLSSPPSSSSAPVVGGEDESLGNESYTTDLDANLAQDAPPSSAPRADTGLKHLPRVDKYAGEESGVTWRAAPPERFAQARGLDMSSPDFAAKYEEYKQSSRVTTDYHTTPEQRDKTRLKKGRGGKVDATHLRRDGTDSTYASEEQVGWVMDPSTANVHTFDPTRMVVKDNGDKVTTHHTTPLAGGDVAGAGLMNIKDGHIHKVSDESGHYRPTADYTHQSVDQMAQQGLLDRQASAKEIRKNKAGTGNMSAHVELSGYDKDDPRQGKQWLADKDYYQGPLDLPYQAFLQTQGNEEQARKKVTMQEELLAKRPRADRHKPTGRQDRGADADVLRSAPELGESSEAENDEHSQPAPDPLRQERGGGYMPDDDINALLAEGPEEELEDEDENDTVDQDSLRALGITSYTMDPNDPTKRIFH